MAISAEALRSLAAEKIQARLHQIREENARSRELEEQRDAEKLELEGSLAKFIHSGWRYIDPSPYSHNWHIDAICDHLQAVTSGDIRRLIVNVPPRHMKSISCSVAWPAWTWARREKGPLSGPQTRFLNISYAQSLSMRDARKSRILLQSPWYQERWSDRFAFTGDQNAKQRYENDQQGYRIATSLTGTATGEGGDAIMIDDPMNALDALSPVELQNVIDWWMEVMPTRLNDQNTGAYVIIMQRLHEKDLTGHILEYETGWTHLCLPARYEPDHPHVYDMDPRTVDGELLWPDKVGQEALTLLERKMGPMATAGQLQQRPTPRGGGMFRLEWLEYYNSMPSIRTMNLYILVDPANEKKDDSDWTAIWVVGLGQDGNYYILDFVRDRFSLNERIKALIRLHRTWRKKGGKILGVAYEKYGKDADIEAIEMIMDIEGYSFTITAVGGATRKTDRIARLEPLFAMGSIRLPYTLHYTQYDGVTVDLINYFVEREYKNFPVSEYKDSLDALARICSEEMSLTWPEPLDDDDPYRDAYSGLGSGGEDSGWAGI